MHWADVAARDIKEHWDGKDTVVLATGITPSGPIHIGNMREMLTADMVHRALSDLGIPNKLIYVSDTFDPLRTLYPFLDDRYKKYIGWPLNRIPCPCGEHTNYAEHFLDPFIKVLDRLGIDLEVVRMHEYYESGKYSEAIQKVLDERLSIRDILINVSGRKLPEDWYPYNPICSKCGSMTTTTPTGYKYPYVEYECTCGHKGKADIRGANGKLPWRVDWPARWWSLGIDFEPFGKDHAASGGSYESASKIIKEVFGRDAPHYVIYEWIQLKGKGAMSSSKGVTVTAEDMISITPPEVLRFLISKYEPKTHIDFDPGLPLLNLVEEFDRYERAYYGLEKIGGKEIEDQKRIYEFARIRNDDRVFNINDQVSFRHAVTLVQLYPDEEILVEKLTGVPLSEMNEEQSDYVISRINAARKWLKKYAPDSVKFTLIRDLGKCEGSLNDDEWEMLRSLAAELEGKAWQADELQDGIFSYAKSNGIPPKNLFSVAYKAFLNRERGPKLGFFMSTMDRAFVLKRLRKEE